MDQYFTIGIIDGRVVLTALLSLFSVVLAIVYRTSERKACCIAMIMSSLGDLFLMNFAQVEDWFPVPVFYVGMLCFVLSHIIYATSFILIIKKHKKPIKNFGIMGGVIIALFTLITCVYLFIKTGGNPISFLIACIAYLFIICFDCSIIFSAAVSTKGMRYVAAIGIVSLMISDLFIAFMKLGNMYQCEWLIWWFYPIGQLLIIIGCGTWERIQSEKSQTTNIQ